MPYPPEIYDLVNSIMDFLPIGATDWLSRVLPS